VIRLYQVVVGQTKMFLQNEKTRGPQRLLLFISYIDGERMRRGEAEEREGEERRVCQD
jgi:hypothetical protein